MGEIFTLLKTVCYIIGISVLPAFVNPVLSQTHIVKDSPTVKGTTVVIPGIEYKRSGYHNFFWGKHYRKEWNTAIRAENFYLDTFRRGLIPFEQGGGRQSKTLRLKDTGGKEYVLRSVNKDFGRALTGMDGTFISHIAKDQVSIGHPFAAYTITPMIAAAGIYHTQPKIVFVPRQGALGEYNSSYGNELYLLEERPDENQSDVAHFGYASNVIGSEKILEKIYDENDNQVEQVSFLRARLFDIFIGDWGRHPDNWRWATFDHGKKTIYKPIPRDRDQAYTRIDGLFPDLAGILRPEIQGFGFSIKHIGDWNFPGRSLDQKFLNALPLDTWIQQARELQQVLTDSLIESSIRLMPPELFNISGATIIAKLKARRDDLQQYAKDYYDYLAKTITILGSEKKELIAIDILQDEKVIVSVSKINKEGQLADTAYYSREFNSRETKDLFIYGLGKKDIIALKGEKRNKIKIHIIDPQDKDSIYTLAGGKKLKGIKFYTGKKFEYDTIRDKTIGFSFIPVFTPYTYSVFKSDPMDLFPRIGIKVSGRILYTPQPWRKKEYQITHSLHALYGFLRTSFSVGYVGRFGRAIGSWDLILKGRLDDPAVENYFGIGNNTELVNKQRNFYRTFSQRYYGGIGLEKNFQNKHHTELSLIYQTVKYRKTDGHYAASGALDPSAFTRKQFAGLEAAYNYDQTGRSIYPTRGFTFDLGGGFLRNLSDTGSSFAKLRSSAAVYLPLSRKFTLAMRAGGSTLFGNPDFYHLNRLGGNAELRGYDRERFYGKSSFYSNTEIRWVTRTRNYLFNGGIGLLGFYDIGRVWVPDEKSRQWHDGYGMGVLILPFNRITLSAVFGLSNEGYNTLFTAELFF